MIVLSDKKCNSWMEEGVDDDCCISWICIYFGENVTNFWLPDKRHLLSDYWDEISERNSSVNYLSFI